MKNNHQRPVKPFSQYPFLAILPAFSGGIVLQQSFSLFSSLTWFSVAISLLLAASLFSVRKSISPRISMTRTVLIALTCMASGAAVSVTADIRSHRSWYGHFTTSSTALKIKVTDIPVLKAKTVFLPATVEAACVSGKWITTTGKLKLYLYRKNMGLNLQQGQELILPNTITAIKNSGNPFAFDVATQAARNGLYHQAFLSGNEVCVVGAATGAPIIQQWKTSLQSSIEYNVKDSITRALIAATLLNERSSLDDNLMDAYSSTGITHIIAISGMHIVLLAACILWLLKIMPSKRLIALKYGIAIIAVWLYIALTGFPPSAVRAAVMFTILALGISLNRVTNAINIWAAAGTLVLSYNPYWLYDVGIQLSFLAVLSILLFYQPVKQWAAPGNALTRWFWEVISVSIAAQILVFPLVIYYFHQFPLLGILANIPAALYSTLLMFGAMIMFVLQALSLPAMWMGTLLTILTEIFNNIIKILAAYTPQLMRNMQIGLPEYGLMMGIIVMFCMGCMQRKGAYLLAGLSLCILFVSVLMIQDLQAMHQARVVVYNTNKVSQADVFRGNAVTHLFSADANQVKYHVRPAMLGYRVKITLTDTIPTTRCIALGHITVIILGRCEIDSSATFPADYLVISDRCVFRPEQWFAAFHPRLIILDGSLPRWKAIQWKAALTEAGAQVHWVQEDGAWIFPRH